MNMALDDSPKISVIVPVYNVEQYLPRCIDSILAQTFTDFEVLLINDGSTDNSGKICDEYARKDSRIRVFHKENGGVASARQLGIDEAQGEYSIHVDGDDWIENDELEIMYKEAIETQYDIISVDYYQNNQYVAEQYESTNLQMIDDMLSGKIRGVMWNKLIRQSLYKIYQIQFPRNINFCEDVYVCTLLFLNTNKIRHMPKAFYHYIDNPQSITRKLKKTTILQRIEFVLEISKHLLQRGISTKCLFWHKFDLKWLMFDSFFFSFEEYNLYFNEIFNLYSYKQYPQYLKNICILYLAQNRLGWNLLKKIRTLKL